MIRVIGFSFIVAVVASMVSGGNSIVVAVAFFGTLALIVYSLLTGRTRLRCPYCLKRVKLGATVCHHCGRAVTSQQA